MAFPINTSNPLAGLSPGSISPTDLYGRVSTSLIAQNASVRKIGADIARDQTRLSGLGQLHSALANFQSLTQSLSGTGLQTGAVASSPAVLTALTTATAKAGTYAVDVKQLAQAQVLATRPQKSQNAALGSGETTTIKVEFGTTSGSTFKSAATAKTITIDSSNNTLQGIASAFNAAGVEAKVVKGPNGYTLQLNGQTGSDNSLKISVGGDAALEKLLTYNPSGARNLAEISVAQDAVLTVDGQQVRSASNVITGAIGGTALALTAKGATNVTVGQDNAAIERNVGNLVSGFNNLTERLTTLRQGGLKADPALAQAQEQLSQLIARNAGALEKVGVTLDRNGTLKIDANALKAAITADSAAVSTLFTNGGKGFADQLGSKIGELTGERSVINKQKVSLDRGINQLASQKAKLTEVLNKQASLLVSQYAQFSQEGETNNALPGLPGGGASSLFDFLA